MTETDEIFVATTEHGEASFICGLAAAGRALPRAAGSRSVRDAAELWAEHGCGWVGVHGFAGAAHAPGLCVCVECRACPRVRVSACVLISDLGAPTVGAARAAPP